MKERKGKRKGTSNRVDEKTDDTGESTTLQAPPRPSGVTNATSAPTITTRRPMPPQPLQPGAVRIGSDGDEELDNLTTRESTTSVTQDDHAAELPVAAELSTDTSEELRVLKQQLQQYQETTVDAVAVGVVDENETNKPLPASATFDMSLFSTKLPDNAVAGVSKGTESIVKGALAGAASVLTEPAVGAKRDGVKGMGRGLVVGVGKCVALPVAGVAVGSYQVAGGLVNSVTAVARGSYKAGKRTADSTATASGSGGSSGSAEEAPESQDVPVVSVREHDVIVGSGRMESGLEYDEDDNIEFEA